jgi:hypothetical protein
MQPQEAGSALLTTRWRYLLAAFALYALCIMGGAAIRHRGQPQLVPLDQASAYNPGAGVFRTWMDWDAMSTGDFSPVFEVAQGRRADPSYRMYRPEELDEHEAAFVYTPLAALMVSPLAGPTDTLESTSDTVSWINHFLALGGALALFLYLFRGALTWVNALLFAGHVAVFFPMAKALELTQVGIWMFFLLAMSLVLLDRGRQALAGIALAVAVCIKPHLILIPFLFAVTRRFPKCFLLACLGGLLALGGISLGYAGIDNLHDYLFKMLPHLSSGYAYAPNQSFSAMLLRTFTDESASVLTLAQPVAWIKLASSLFGIGLLVSVGVASRGRLDGEWGDTHGLFFGLVVAAATLASPVCWMHHYVLLAIPLVTAARALRRHPVLGRGALDLALLMGAVLLSFYFDGQYAPAILANLEFYGAMIVFVCSLAMLRRLNFEA